ncbi:MAG: tRNA (adenosine(37)-N6)-threonylcarbamoyltransferase complex dimerization subunit type 1 TsaB [Elusimicrobia bacterium]|nr:tRNA (adenosine(37)-N6)-threonylcarbamoyltransferase complex dimerization subunit type 1 TsaB [Elusimicrobiota bacterium]
MKILAIETSGDICGVALLNKDRIIAEKNAVLPRNSSSSIFEMLKTVSKKAVFDCLAVDIGPGSFTGIRIGVSLARAYGQFLKIPVIGISSLDCLVFNAVSKNNISGKIYSVIDALREEVYMGEYDGLKRKKEYKIITIKKLKEMLNGKCTVVGDKRVCEKINNKYINVKLTASAVGFLAIAKFSEEQNSTNYKGILPLYIRRAFAEERTKI